MDGGLSEAEKRLARALEREPVAAAWVFGSQAGGTPGPMSDVDVALLPAGEMESRARFGLIGRVASEAQRIWGVRRADVIFLDEAGPELAFEAIGGRLVVERDAEARIEAEVRIMAEYQDIRYYLERHRAILRERYAAGDFA